MKKLDFALIREGQLQTIIANMWIGRNVGKDWKELFGNKRTSSIFDLLVIANRKSTLYFKIMHIDKLLQFLVSANLTQLSLIERLSF